MTFIDEYRICRSFGLPRRAALSMVWDVIVKLPYLPHREYVTFIDADPRRPMRWCWRGHVLWPRELK